MSTDVSDEHDAAAANHSRHAARGGGHDSRDIARSRSHGTRHMHGVVFHAGSRRTLSCDGDCRSAEKRRRHAPGRCPAWSAPSVLCAQRAPVHLSCGRAATARGRARAYTALRRAAHPQPQARRLAAPRRRRCRCHATSRGRLRRSCAGARPRTDPGSHRRTLETETATAARAAAQRPPHAARRPPPPRRGPPPPTLQPSGVAPPMAQRPRSAPAAASASARPVAVGGPRAAAAVSSLRAHQSAAAGQERIPARGGRRRRHWQGDAAA